MNKLALIWKTKQIRNKILVVLGLLLVTRFISMVPIPGVEIGSLKQILAQSQFLGFLDAFSGGGLSSFSIAMLGVGPYITASIIVQLLTVIIPRFTEMQKEEGEAGREKLNRLTRVLTVPMAVLQTYGTIRLLKSQGAADVLGNFTPFEWFLVMLSVCAGTMIVMWIGEVISEYGIGNGVSLIIFAGIVSQLPATLSGVVGLLDQSNIGILIGYAAMILAVIVGVVLVSEAQRNIQVSYAKRVRGDKVFGGVDTHLPLRLNQAGVIPIIFAISLMMFPALIAQFFLNARSHLIAEYAQKIIDLFNQQGVGYGIAYFVLVVMFTFFYTAIVFNPDEVAENLQKNGGFVPGLRPGKQTADYLYSVLSKITFPGSVFLGLIAILPFIFQAVTNLQVLSFGGTSLLIVVGVVIETLKQIDGQLSMHDYDSI